MRLIFDFLVSLSPECLEEIEPDVFLGDWEVVTCFRRAVEVVRSLAKIGRLLDEELM